MLIDSPASVADVKYYYVKSFKWMDPIVNEQFNGNPKKGKIYRGWQNVNTEGYRLVYRNMTALILESLHSDGSSVPYISEIVEITPNSILDLPLTEKDLDMLSVWLDSNHADIIPTETPIMSIPELISKAVTQKDEFQVILEGVHEDIEHVADMDTLLLYQLAKVLDYSLDELHTIRTGPMDYDWLQMDKENGMGANMDAIFKSLYRYMSEKNEEDLISAISHLLTEMKRREHNNLNK